jgi:hypothetical protein
MSDAPTSEQNRPDSLLPDDGFDIAELVPVGDHVVLRYAATELLEDSPERFPHRRRYQRRAPGKPVKR